MAARRRAAAAFAVLMALDMPGAQAASIDHSQASHSEQMHAWAWMTGFSVVGVFAIFFLGREFTRNKAMRTPGVFSFMGQIVGDFVYLVAWLPFLIQSLADGEPADGDLCKYTTYAVSAGGVVSSWASALVAVTSYYELAGALKVRGRRGAWASNGMLCLLWTIAAAQGLWWAGLLTADGKNGIWRSLYCFTSDWNSFSTGGIFLIHLTVPATIMTGYYYSAWRLVASHTGGGLPKRSRRNVGLRERAERAAGRKFAVLMAKRGALLTSLFLCAWLPLAIAVFLDFAGTAWPLGLEYLVLWAPSWKVLGDVVVIYTFPGVRKEREKRRRGITDVDRHTDVTDPEDPDHDDTVQQVLLLGVEESGKTTILKQLKILHGSGYSREEALEFKTVIHNNIMTAFKVLCNDVQDDAMAYATLSTRQKTDVTQLLGCANDAKLTSERAFQIQELWRAQCFRNAYDQRMIRGFDVHGEFLSNTGQYLNEVRRIGAEEYVPNLNDILNVRKRTRYAQSNDFEIEGTKFRVWDLVGQKLDRFRFRFKGKLTAVLFVGALTEFDQDSLDDPSVNRLDESLNLFRQATNKLFPDLPTILFLNKTDLFKERLKHVRFQDSFPDFDETDEEASVTGRPAESKFERAAQHVEQLYRRERGGAAGAGHQAELYVMRTTATDQRNMQFILGSVKDILLRQAFQSLGFGSTAGADRSLLTGGRVGSISSLPDAPRKPASLLRFRQQLKVNRLRAEQALRQKEEQQQGQRRELEEEKQDSVVRFIGGGQAAEGSLSEQAQQQEQGGQSGTNGASFPEGQLQEEPVVPMRRESVSRKDSYSPRLSPSVSSSRQSPKPLAASPAATRPVTRNDQDGNDGDVVHITIGDVEYSVMDV